MNNGGRSLDDVDRLGFRLSRIIREQYPHLATQGFTLGDLEERLLPFREARRELADGGMDGWERTMLRLLSGERGVLVAEAGLRDACVSALSMPSPTLALVRTYSSSVLTVGSPVEAGVSVRTPVHVAAVHGCRFCGGRLPGGRHLTYCPHCGVDLTKRQCPACSTELEIDWQFCVTCGRGAERAEKPELVSRTAG